MGDDLLDAARRYLDVGVSILFLVGKVPHATLHRHGLRTPISRPSELPKRLPPSVTGIGIPIPERVVVIDLDDGDAVRRFRELVEIVPVTPTATTARGLHLWFISPHIHRSTKLGPGFDIRGVGAYVVVPPSRHESGAVYRWVVPLLSDDADAAGLGPMEWLPDPIEDFLRRRMEVLTSFRASLKASGSRDLAPLVRFVEASKPGERNCRLFWAACRASEAGVSFDEAAKAFAPAAASIRLPVAEAYRTIRSAYQVVLNEHEIR